MTSHLLLDGIAHWFERMVDTFTIFTTLAFDSLYATWAYLVSLDVLPTGIVDTITSLIGRSDFLAFILQQPLVAIMFTPLVFAYILYQLIIWVFNLVT